MWSGRFELLGYLLNVIPSSKPLWAWFLRRLDKFVMTKNRITNKIKGLDRLSKPFVFG